MHIVLIQNETCKPPRDFCPTLYKYLECIGNYVLKEFLIKTKFIETYQ